MGDHIDRKATKRGKQMSEDDLARRRRVSFKNYLREVEESLLEDAIDENDDELNDDQDD